VTDKKKKKFIKNTNILDIVLITNKESTYSDILVSVETCLNQEGPEPNSVIIVVSAELDFFELVAQLRPEFKDSKVKPLFVKAFESDITLLEKIDIGVSKCQGVYYSVFNIGSDIPTNLVAIIHSMIQREDKTVMIEPEEGVDGLTVQVHAHNFLAGNNGGAISDKIKYMAKEEGNEGFVKQWIDQE